MSRFYVLTTKGSGRLEKLRERDTLSPRQELLLELLDIVEETSYLSPGDQDHPAFEEGLKGGLLKEESTEPEVLLGPIERENPELGRVLRTYYRLASEGSESLSRKDLVGALETLKSLSFTDYEEFQIGSELDKRELAIRLDSVMSKLHREHLGVESPEFPLHKEVGLFLDTLAR